MKTLIGRGKLAWPGQERRSDRYGSVGLYTESDAPIKLPAETEKLSGKLGHLECVIVETRKSHHIGDLFRGIFPSTPEVGEVIRIGTGKFEVYWPDDPKSLELVSLEPEDGRRTDWLDWLDPKKLYRCHDQTVDLYFVEDV